MSEVILKPCPFCGERLIHLGFRVDSPIRNYAECCKCLAKVTGYDTDDEAVAAWNTRVPTKAFEISMVTDDRNSEG